MSRHLPGLTWRILAHHKPPGDYGRAAIDLTFRAGQRVEFDELVLGDPCALHIEQMDDRDWMVNIAGWNGNLHIPVNGSPHLEWHETPDA